VNQAVEIWRRALLFGTLSTGCRRLGHACI
jgi:hypothetical protein